VIPENMKDVGNENEFISEPFIVDRPEEPGWLIRVKTGNDVEEKITNAIGRLVCLDFLLCTNQAKSLRLAKLL